MRNFIICIGRKEKQESELTANEMKNLVGVLDFVFSVLIKLALSNSFHCYQLYILAKEKREDVIRSKGRMQNGRKQGKCVAPKLQIKKKSRKQNKGWVGNKLLAHRGTLVGGS